jgi:hypothetical protein
MICIEAFPKETKYWYGMNRVYRNSHEDIRSDSHPPTSKGTGENSLILLQRQFGNKAVASLFGAKSHAKLGGESNGMVLQRKKTQIENKEDLSALRKTWNFMPKKTAFSSSLGEEEKSNIMLSDLGNVYDSYLEKGTRYLSDLSANRKKYGESASEYTSSVQPKREVYDANFANHYVTALKSGQGQEGTATHVSSSGFVGDERPEKPRANVYENLFDFNKNTIHAHDNYATKDEARLHDSAMKKEKAEHKDIGLPNSEILWQQGLAAAKSQLYFSSWNGNQRAKSAMKSIKTIRRENIQNPDTRAVVFMAYPNGQAYWSADQTWGKDTNDFKAVMGTPNAATAIHMLNDHLDEITANDIADVTATKSEHLVIRLE